VFVVPSEVAAWRKFRLGQVAPGTEANHRVQVANLRASSLSTGTCEVAWQHMASGPRPVTVAWAVSWLNKLITGASTPSKEELASPRPVRSQLTTKPWLSTAPPATEGPSRGHSLIDPAFDLRAWNPTVGLRLAPRLAAQNSLGGGQNAVVWQLTILVTAHPPGAARKTALQDGPPIPEQNDRGCACFQASISVLVPFEDRLQTGAPRGRKASRPIKRYASFGQ